MQSRDLPSAQFEDPSLVQTQPAGRARVMWRMGKAWGGGGCGGAGRTATGWKHAAAGGLRDAFNHYSQVKYQVVVALFGDAVMEPHYGRDRRVTGMPGSHPAPRECLCSALGTSRSWGRAEWDYSSSLLLLLLPLAGWGGVPAQPQPWPQPWAVVQGSKVTSKSGTACGQCLAKVPGSCWAILGAGQAAGMGAPSPALCSIRRGAQAQGELSQGAGLPALAPTGLFFIFCS